MTRAAPWFCPSSCALALRRLDDPMEFDWRSIATRLADPRHAPWRGFDSAARPLPKVPCPKKYKIFCFGFSGFA